MSSTPNTVKRIAVVVCMALAASPAVAGSADVWGKWFCYYEHRVGIFPAYHGKPGYAGKINIATDQQKFFITITHLKYDDSTIDFCKQNAEAYDVIVRETREFKDGDNQRNARTVWPREWVAYHCYAADELSLKEPDYPTPHRYRSYQGQSAFFGLDNTEWFNLFGDHSFQRGQNYDEGPTLATGRCEKIDG
jgi:hypothetical protein